MNYILLLPAVVSFLSCLFLMPSWIKKAKQINLLWKDMNKYNDIKMAGSGGIVVILSFTFGVFLYIAYRVFFLKEPNNFLVQIFALLTVIILLAGVGFIDDLLGWQRGGLSKWTRLVLVAFASVPLIAINAGKSEIGMPFFGVIDLGIIYPLIFIPIGIVGATVTFNFLAGFNGLEAGQGILLLVASGIVAYFTGSSWLSIVALYMIVALLAFLIFNYYPARVFPGNSLTYGIGGLIAIMSILGNFEKIALFFFIPYVIETALKLRGNLAKQSFGNPKEDGSLELKYEKIYSLNHLSILLMKKIGIKPTERKIVFFIWMFQILIIILGFIIFREGVF